MLSLDILHSSLPIIYTNGCIHSLIITIAITHYTWHLYATTTSYQNVRTFYLYSDILSFVISIILSYFCKMSHVHTLDDRNVHTQRGKRSRRVRQKRKQRDKKWSWTYRGCHLIRLRSYPECHGTTMQQYNRRRTLANRLGKRKKERRNHLRENLENQNFTVDSFFSHFVGNVYASGHRGGPFTRLRNSRTKRVRFRISIAVWSSRTRSVRLHVEQEGGRTRTETSVPNVVGQVRG